MKTEKRTTSDWVVEERARVADAITPPFSVTYSSGPAVSIVIMKVQHPIATILNGPFPLISQPERTARETMKKIPSGKKDNLRVLRLDARFVIVNGEVVLRMIEGE